MDGRTRTDEDGRRPKHEERIKRGRLNSIISPRVQEGEGEKAMPAQPVRVSERLKRKPVYGTANFSLRACENSAFWLPLDTGASFHMSAGGERGDFSRALCTVCVCARQSYFVNTRVLANRIRQRQKP